LREKADKTLLTYKVIFDKRSLHVFYLEAIMATGIVRFFNLQKGYGFIRPDEGDEEIFVHKEQVAKAGLSNLQKGQRLSFDVRSPQKQGERLTALNLELM